MLKKEEGGEEEDRASYVSHSDSREESRCRKTNRENSGARRAGGSVDMLHKHGVIGGVAREREREIRGCVCDLSRTKG